MSNLFQNIQVQAFKAGITPRTKESRQWFMNKVKGLRAARMKRDELMKEGDLVIKSSPTVGSMYMYYYDPKWKDTLPYYDTFPLVVVVGPAEGGFYGLNLHYLPPILRAKMLDALMENLNNRKYDKSTRFEINYRMLKRMGGTPYYKAALKHYLYPQVNSKFAEIQPTEWEIATFLPTASWKKKGANAVYQDSRKRMG